MRDVMSRAGNRMFIFDSQVELTDWTDPNQYWMARESGTQAGMDLPTWESMVKAVRSAWPYGIGVLQQFVDRLTDSPLPELKDKRRRVRFREDNGDELDLDRLRAGQAYWHSAVREDTPGPVEVTIISDLSAPWWMDSKDLLWRGAAAVALTRVLEDAGYRVELWVVTSNVLFKHHLYSALFATCLKRCPDTLDTSTLVNSVSGWYYRTAMFTAMYTACARLKKERRKRLGPVTLPKAGDLDELSRDVNRIFSAGVYSFDGALEMIKAELQKVAERSEGV